MRKALKAMTHTPAQSSIGPQRDKQAISEKTAFFQMNNPISPSHRRSAWIKLFAGILILACMVFEVGSMISRFWAPAYYENEKLKALGICANGLFYTDTPAFADADQFVSDSFRFSPRNRHVPE